MSLGDLALSLQGMDEKGEQKARVLLFSLGGENYAVDLDPIEAILPDQVLSQIPKQPALFEGFFEFPGECLPVVKLNRLLGGVAPCAWPLGKILVIRHEGFRLAFRVDTILGTREWEKVETLSGSSLHETESLEVDGQIYLLLKLDSLLPSKHLEGARP